LLHLVNKSQFTTPQVRLSYLQSCYNNGVPDQPAHALTYRLAAEADGPRLLALLAELRVPVAGSTSPAAQRALVRATGDARLVLMLAESDARLAGVGIGVLDPQRFWRALALRNPVLVMERIPALIRRRLRRRATQAGEAADPAGLAALLSPPSTLDSATSSPAIGQVALVLLHPDLRRRGDSPAFLRALLDELHRRGATRMVARIARSNIASVRMCRAIGVSVEDRGATLFATAQLPLRDGGR
jgi:GNAT superfamily N-acetyltransferase